ncbi:MAG: TetR/AcrR family transcriptional regulator [Spirochaetes bacterium]|nr:TetR/AcrR family transcriptional regulator [Spirochaetota bacterium]
MGAGKKEDDITMRDRIIRATIECIEKHGLHDLTVRRIAREAGVNVAAINYYFGSKEKLVDEVFQKTIYTGFDENIDDFLKDYKESPDTALEQFLRHFMAGGLQYPNLVKIHFYEAFVNNNYKTLSAKGVSAFLDKFETTVSSCMDKKKGNQCKIEMTQFWSAVFFPIVFPGLFRDYTGVDFKDQAWLEMYIRRLVKMYF